MTRRLAPARRAGLLRYVRSPPASPALQAGAQRRATRVLSFGTMALNAEYNVPSPDDRVTVVCLHCSRPQDVGRKAMTITCKHCSKPLDLRDKQYAAYEARRNIETCGIVTVEKKGN